MTITRAARREGRAARLPKQPSARSAIQCPLSQSLGLHLISWRNMNVSVGRGYGSGHSVARLFAEISKVKVPVDLSHLHTTMVR